MSSSFVKDCTDVSGAGGSSSNKTIIIIVNNDSGNLAGQDIQNLLESHGANPSQVSVVQMGQGGNNPQGDFATPSFAVGNLCGQPDSSMLESDASVNFMVDGFHALPIEDGSGYAELPLDADAFQSLESVLESKEAKEILGGPLIDMVDNPDAVDNLDGLMSNSGAESESPNSCGPTKRIKSPTRRSQRQMDKAEREEVVKILAENQRMLRQEREDLKRAQEEKEKMENESNDKENPSVIMEAESREEKVKTIKVKKKIVLVVPPEKDKSKERDKDQILQLGEINTKEKEEPSYVEGGEKEEAEDRQGSTKNVHSKPPLEEVKENVKILKDIKMKSLTVNVQKLDVKTMQPKLQRDIETDPLEILNNEEKEANDKSISSKFISETTKSQIVLTSKDEHRLNSPEIHSLTTRGPKTEEEPSFNKSEFRQPNIIPNTSSKDSSEKQERMNESDELKMESKQRINSTEMDDEKNKTEDSGSEVNKSHAKSAVDKSQINTDLVKKSSVPATGEQTDQGKDNPGTINKEPVSKKVIIRRNFLHVTNPVEKQQVVQLNVFKSKENNEVKAKVASTQAVCSPGPMVDDMKKSQSDVSTQKQLKPTERHPVADTSIQKAPTSVSVSSNLKKCVPNNLESVEKQAKPNAKPQASSISPNKLITPMKVIKPVEKIMSSNPKSPLLSQSPSIPKSLMNYKIPLKNSAKRLPQTVFNPTNVNPNSQQSTNSHKKDGPHASGPSPSSIKNSSKQSLTKPSAEPIVKTKFFASFKSALKTSPKKKKKDFSDAPSKEISQVTQESIRRSKRPPKKKSFGDDILFLDGKNSFLDENGERIHDAIELEEHIDSDVEGSLDRPPSSDEGEEEGQEEEEEEEEGDEYDDPERLWCICQKPHSNRFMICCDRCEDWFHGSCVGVTKAMGKQWEEIEKEWICPNCKKAERAIKGLSSPKNESLTPKKIKKESKSSSEKSSVSNSDHSEARVLIYEKDTGIVLSGSAAPTLDMLPYWLETNPNHAPLLPSMMSSIKTDPKTGQKRIPLNSTTPAKDIDLQKTAFKSKNFYGSSPKKRKEKRSRSPKKEMPPGKDGTIALKTIRGLLAKKPLKLNSKRLSDETPDKESSPKVKDHHRKPSFDKPDHDFADKRPKDKKEKILKTPDVEKKPNIPIIRNSVKKMLFEALDKRRQEVPNEFAGLKSQGLLRLCEQIEEQLYLTFNKDLGFKYKTRYRSLVFNIRDGKNGGLFRQILTGTIPPKKLAGMTSEELASKELAEWREKEEKKELEAIQKHELERLALGNQYIMKSHKGEIMIDKDEFSKSKETVPVSLSTLPATEQEATPPSADVDEDLINSHKNHIYDAYCKICLDSYKDKEEKYSDDNHKEREKLKEERRRTESESSRHKHKKRTKDRERERSRERQRHDGADHSKPKPSDRQSSDESDRHRSRHKSDSNRHKKKERPRSSERKLSESGSKHRRNSRRESEGDHRSRDSKDQRRRHDDSRRRDSDPSHRKRKHSYEHHKIKDISLKKRKSDLIGRDDKPDAKEQNTEGYYSDSKPEVTTSDDVVVFSSNASSAEMDSVLDVEPTSTGSPDPGKEESYTPEPVGGGKRSHLEYSPSTPPLPENEIQSPGTPPISTELDELLLSPATPPLPSEGERLTPPLPVEELDGQPLQKPGQLFPIWKGAINMPDVARFNGASFEVSGKALYFTGVPSTLEIVGRINPDTVWSYIAQMKKSGSKEILVTRFQPSSEEEKIAYIALYSYLSSKKRYGVIGNCEKSVKDFYIVPLAAHQPIPQVLLPLDGPGFEESRPHMLIGVVVRVKYRRIYDPNSGSWIDIGGAPHRNSIDDDPSEVISSILAEDEAELDERSYTPPPPPALANESKSDSDDDDDSVKDAPVRAHSKPSSHSKAAAPFDRDSMLAELNRQIERDREELSEMRKTMGKQIEENDSLTPSGSPSSNAEAMTLDTSKINIPSNLPEILDIIKTKQLAIQEKELELKRTLALNADSESGPSKDVDLRRFAAPRSDSGEAVKDQDMRFLTNLSMVGQPVSEDTDFRSRDPRSLRSSSSDEEDDMAFPSSRGTLSKMSDADLLAKVIEMESCPEAPKASPPRPRECEDPRLLHPANHPFGGGPSHGIPHLSPPMKSTLLPQPLASHGERDHRIPMAPFEPLKPGLAGPMPHGGGPPFGPPGENRFLSGHGRPPPIGRPPHNFNEPPFPPGNSLPYHEPPTGGDCGPQQFSYPGDGFDPRFRGEPRGGRPNRGGRGEPWRGKRRNSEHWDRGQYPPQEPPWPPNEDRPPRDWDQEAPYQDRHPDHGDHWNKSRKRRWKGEGPHDRRKWRKDPPSWNRTFSEGAQNMNY